jgi:hypothetical protein
LHRGEWEQVAELLRIRVLKFFAKKGKLSAQEAEKMRQWHHSGFGIHAGHRIQKDATDSQGARAPPPTYDQEAPELPFASFLDGIVYELEPWEQARRERLASYARERDDLAGIVVYDGEWDDTNDSPSESDPAQRIGVTLSP